MSKKRNELFHFHDQEIGSDVTLRIVFGLIVPFLELYDQEDLNYLYDCIETFDGVINEGYLIEQLDGYNIPYSEITKNRFAVT